MESLSQPQMGSEDDFGPLEDEIVKPIQPYQARKTYLCPGCNADIAVGEGHLVVVPKPSPDLRRHWHRGCWHKERRRRGDHRSVDVAQPRNRDGV